MRIRDIVHVSGPALRIGLNDSGEGHLALHLSDPAKLQASTVQLDLYGGELLAGFVLTARLASPDEDIAEERSGGPFGCRISLRGKTRRASIDIRQAGQSLIVSNLLWDRLYAELLIALAHGRHGNHGAFPPRRDSRAHSRLLH